MQRSRTVPIHEFRDFVADDFYKIRNYRIFPFYFVCLLFLIAFLLSNKSHNSSSTASYYIVKGVRRLYHDGEFMNIMAINDFYTWFEGIVGATYSAPGQHEEAFRDPARPVTFMLLRQQRVALGECTPPVLELPRNITTFMNASNFRCRSSSMRPLTRPYGDPANPWHSNRMLQEDRIPDGGRYSGRIYSFNFQKEEQFSVKMFYSMNPTPGVENATLPTNLIADHPPALDELKRMRRFQWIDIATTIAAVEVLYYIPSSEFFVKIAFLVEHTPSGLLLPSIDGIAFRIDAFGSNKANFSFFVDLLMLLAALGLTYEWLGLMWINYTFSRSIVKAVMRFWVIGAAVIIVLFWIVFVWRMQLWHFSNVNNSERVYAELDVEQMMTRAFNGISWAGKKQEDAFILLSIAVILYTLKMLMYVQYVAGIHLISETIRRSLRDIAGVGIITVVLLMTFATSGTVFFGAFSADFATWSISFVTLTRILVASNIVVYDDLSTYAPRVTAVFFISFYFFLSLLALNLVLGILVTGYATAKSSSKSRLKDQEVESISAVIRRYVLMKGMEYKDETHLAAKYLGKGMSTSVAAASAALRTQISLRKRLERLDYFYRARFEAVVELDRLIAHGETLVRREELDRMFPMMAPTLHIFLFDVFHSRWTNRQQTVGDVAANEDEIAYKLACVQQNIERAHAKIKGDLEALENGNGLLDTDEEEELERQRLEADGAAPTIDEMPSGMFSGIGSAFMSNLGSVNAGIGGSYAASSRAGALTGGLHRTGRLIVRRNGEALVATSSSLTGMSSLRAGAARGGVGDVVPGVGVFGAE